MATPGRPFIHREAAHRRVHREGPAPFRATHPSRTCATSCITRAPEGRGVDQVGGRAVLRLPQRQTCATWPRFKQHCAFGFWAARREIPDFPSSVAEARGGAAASVAIRARSTTCPPEGAELLSRPSIRARAMRLNEAGPRPENVPRAPKTAASFDARGPFAKGPSPPSARRAHWPPSTTSRRGAPRREYVEWDRRKRSDPGTARPGAPSRPQVEWISEGQEAQLESTKR